MSAVSPAVEGRIYCSDVNHPVKHHGLQDTGRRALLHYSAHQTPRILRPRNPPKPAGLAADKKPSRLQQTHSSQTERRGGCCFVFRVNPKSRENTGSGDRTSPYINCSMARQEPRQHHRVDVIAQDTTSTAAPRQADQRVQTADRNRTLRPHPTWNL